MATPKKTKEQQTPEVKEEAQNLTLSDPAELTVKTSSEPTVVKEGSFTIIHH